MPYEPYGQEKTDEPYKSPHPCDLCGADDEPVHAVETGDGFLTLCVTCRSEAAGGS
jgi:hypothetical protein